MSRLRVAAIIPTYNRPDMVLEAVASVLAQSRLPDEIVVVDDGSSPEAVAAVRQGLPDGVRFIEQPNGGVAVARNTGVEATTSELVAFLDDDDRWLRHKVARQAERFEADDALGLVHVGVIRHVDDRAIAVLLDGHEGFVAPDLLRADGNVILGGGSGMMLRRSAWADVGGFRDLRVCEDWDLWLRLSVTWKVGFVPLPLLAYRVHEGNISWDVARRAATARGIVASAYEGRDELCGVSRKEASARVDLMLASWLWGSGDRLGALRTGVGAAWRWPRALDRLTRIPGRRRARQRDALAHLGDAFAEMGSWDPPGDR